MDIGVNGRVDKPRKVTIPLQHRLPRARHLDSMFAWLTMAGCNFQSVTRRTYEVGQLNRVANSI